MLHFSERERDMKFHSLDTSNISYANVVVYLSIYAFNAYSSKEKIRKKFRIIPITQCYCYH